MPARDLSRAMPWVPIWVASPLSLASLAIWRASPMAQVSGFSQ
jgi:hypothetical protein